LWKLQTDFFKAEREYKKVGFPTTIKLFCRSGKGISRQARSNPTVRVYPNPCTLA